MPSLLGAGVLDFALPGGGQVNSLEEGYAWGTGVGENYSAGLKRNFFFLFDSRNTTKPK